MTPSRAPVRNGARLPKGGRFLPGTSRRVLCRMIKRSSPGKARDTLVACCKRKEGNGIWSIARGLTRPYSTIRGWLVRMVRRGLGGRFDWKSTGRKKILNPQTLKKIMGWTRRDPSRYGFGPASWRLDMVNEMIRRETGRHARPRTLRRILRRLGLSYSKPRPVPRKTAPTEEQDMFKERVKRTILGVSGHGYAVLAIDEAGIVLARTIRSFWRKMLLGTDHHVTLFSTSFNFSGLHAGTGDCRTLLECRVAYFYRQV